MLVGVRPLELRHAVMRGGGQALLGGSDGQGLLAVREGLVQVLRLLVVVAHRGRRGIVGVPLAAGPEAPPAGALLLDDLREEPGELGEGWEGSCDGVECGWGFDWDSFILISMTIVVCDIKVISSCSAFITSLS